MWSYKTRQCQRKRYRTQLSHRHRAQNVLKYACLQSENNVTARAVDSRSPPGVRVLARSRVSLLKKTLTLGPICFVWRAKAMFHHWHYMCIQMELGQRCPYAVRLAPLT